MSAALEQKRHRGRKRNIFPALCMLVTGMVLLFIGSAIFAIVAGGISHFGEVISSEEVLFSLRMSVTTSSIISAFVLTWARGMGEFGATLMLVGVTRMKTETLPGSIYLSISTGNTETAMATAMIMLLVSAFTLVVANVLDRPTGESRVGRTGKGLGLRRMGKCGECEGKR